MSQRYLFASWNVNGLRAVIKKSPSFEEITQELDADVFALQETKLQEGQVDLDLPGYFQTWSYAERKAADLKNLKHYGKRRIEQELYSKGISREDIAAAVERLNFEDTEDILCPLVRKKLAGNFERKSIDRTIRYFIYRGYEISDIKSCIERIEGDTDEL